MQHISCTKYNLICFKLFPTLHKQKLFDLSVIINRNNLLTVLQGSATQVLLIRATSAPSSRNSQQTSLRWAHGKQAGADPSPPSR